MASHGILRRVVLCTGVDLARRFLVALLIPILLILSVPPPAHASIPDILNNPLLKLIAPGPELGDLTGYNGKRLYLVIFQNDLELRPTGGFIGYVAMLEFSNGQANVVRTQRVYPLYYAYYDYLQATGFADLIPNPHPYWIFGPYRHWGLLNGNFSPDFPASSEYILAEYEREATQFNLRHYGDTLTYTSDESFAGVMGLDTKAVAYAIEALGGSVTLDSPGMEWDGDTITSTNLGLQLQLYEFGSYSPPHTAADFFADLTSQVIEAVDSAGSDRESSLVNKMLQAFAQKHVVWYSTDATNQAALVKLGWSGAMTNLPGDYLQISDANIGGYNSDDRNSKVNEYVTRHIDYRPTLRSNGTVAAEVDVTYANLGVPGYFEDTRFAGFENSPYLSWTRAVVPPQANYITGDGYITYAVCDPQITVIPTQVKEWGKSLFGSHMWIPPGESRTLRYWYNTPSVLQSTSVGHTYFLSAQKQPGTQADTLTVSLQSPDEYVTRAYVDAQWASPHAWRYQTDLLYDRRLGLELAKGFVALPRLMELGAPAGSLVVVNGGRSAARVKTAGFRSSGVQAFEKGARLAAKAGMVVGLSSMRGAGAVRTGDVQAGSAGVVAGYREVSAKGPGVGLAAGVGEDRIGGTVVVPDARDSKTGTTGQVTISNPTVARASVQVKLWNRNGSLAGSTRRTVAAHGMTNVRPSAVLGRSFSGAATAESSVPVAGSVVEYSGDGRILGMAAGEAVDNEVLPAWVPGADSTLDRRVEIVVHNYAASSRTVKVIAFGTNGHSRGQRRFSLGAHRSTIVDVGSLVRGVFRGSVRIEGRDVVSAGRISRRVTGRDYALTSAVRFVSSVRRATVPRLIDDARRAGTVYAANLGTSRKRITLFFYSRSGRRIGRYSEVVEPRGRIAVRPSARLRSAFDGSVIVTSGASLAVYYDEVGRSGRSLGAAEAAHGR